MEKLMYTFLDTMYPKLFMLKTKFGNTPYYYNGNTFVLCELKHKTAYKLSDYFCCSYNYADIVYDRWLETKPVCIRVTNPEDSTKSIYIPA